MLKLTTNILIYATYLVVVGFLAFVLWQALFGSRDVVDSHSQGHAAQSEQQNPSKQLPGASVSPRPHNPAEQAIAYYTQWLAVFTSLLVLATVALFVSGERNVEVARASSEAANKSVQLAEQALIAGQRAFVSVRFRQSPITGPNKEIVGWTIAPIWENNGNTPTRDAIMNFAYLMHFQGSNLPPEWDFPDIEDAKGKNGPFQLGSIPPKGIRAGRAFFVPASQLESIIFGKISLFMWGWIEYKDVLPSTPLHVTRFAVRVVPTGNPRQTDGMGVFYEFLDEYNCSDEECARQGRPVGWRPRIGQFPPPAPNQPTEKK